jgi:hypothetical protein
MVVLSKWEWRYSSAFSGGAGMPGRGCLFPEKLARSEDALSPSVTRPAEVLQKRLQQDNESTRLSLSTAVRKGAAGELVRE